MLKNISMPVIALALGHLVTDLQAGALPIVLPHLKELFALSYSQLAFIVLTQNVTSSVIQPLFGYITDKKSLPAMLPFAVQAQNTFALKTNALYWATATPNLGAEFAFKDKHSVQLFYGYNPWRFSERASLRHWVLQPEYRYWFCQGLNGWFVGVHLMGGEFNLGEIDLPLGIWDDLSERRYEGHYYGGGVTVGYQVPISRHWGFEASIGVGYDHITAAIGGAISASAGADFLCYVTPAEHLCLPDAKDVLDGLIATRIAAHAADIAKGVPGAREADDRMGDARRRLAWGEMWDYALDPDTARARHEASPASTEGTCTMCGKMCAVRTVNKVFEGTTIDLDLE